MASRDPHPARRPAKRATGGRGPAAAGERPPRAEYRVRARVWLHPGAGGWHFANLSPRQSEEIRVRFAEVRRGWGSVPVTVRVGRTVWHTSLFPDTKSDTYLFAIKAEVRKREGISAGDSISAVVHVR